LVIEHVDEQKTFLKPFCREARGDRNQGLAWPRESVAALPLHRYRIAETAIARVVEEFNFEQRPELVFLCIPFC
jgi:hypothetical protein